MKMSLLRALKVFGLGFAGGVVVYFFLHHWGSEEKLLGLLKLKVEGQEKLLGARGGVLFNNILASLLSSYGGLFTTLLFLRLNSNTDPRLKVLKRLDTRLKGVEERNLRFYLSLFLFPFCILLFTGLALGFVAGFYHPLEFLSLLSPYGVTELPAIIISGAIGFKIGESSLREKDFYRTLLREGKKNFKFYLLVLFLLAVSALLEA